jgi:DNA-directed RNA polymerase specialized sigma subunit, sigma24 homolog
MTEFSAASIEIRPLTKRRRDSGEVYTRRPDVEQQLAEVLRLDKTKIFERLAEKKGSARYLHDETLVYLIKKARAGDDQEMIENIYPELHVRLRKLLNRYRKYLGETDFEDFEQKITLNVLEKILDTESDAADYAEVNFGDFVATLANGECGSALKKINREQTVLYQQRDDEDESQVMENNLESNEISPETLVLLREGVHKLPAKTRKVAILLLDGWQIESKDKNQPTISKCLNVSSRAIRNWLKEARQILAGYEGEIR